MEIKMSISPLKRVQEKFSSKEKLVDQLTGKLLSQDGESKADFKDRLLKVPSSKLLKLLKAEARLEKLGGRDAIVTKIKENYSKFSPKLADNFFDKYQKFSSGKLMEALKATQKKANR